MIHEFKNPIPVIVEDGIHGYAIYVRCGGTFENDIWCVTHCGGGVVRHYRSDQLLIYKNATFDIEPIPEEKSEEQFVPFKPYKKPESADSGKTGDTQ
jgi:hypothetical protein